MNGFKYLMTMEQAPETTDLVYGPSYQAYGPEDIDMQAIDKLIDLMGPITQANQVVEEL